MATLSATEIASTYRQEGMELVSMTELAQRFADLGYRVDRDMDCRSVARIMTGPLAGYSYPACSTGLKEADTGTSAWNVDARRDEKYREMQKLRGAIFALSRGAIFQV